MTDKPVVVYGASGYTGRLICEYLREYNVPFLAAGRNKTSAQQSSTKIPGIRRECTRWSRSSTPSRR